MVIELRVGEYYTAKSYKESNLTLQKENIN
jgi:hypothetical protein